MLSSSFLGHRTSGRNCETIERLVSKIPPRFEVPQSLAPHQQPVKAITLHAFGGASKNGASAAVNAVAEQDQATTQGVVCAKTRLAKQNLSILR